MGMKSYAAKTADSEPIEVQYDFGDTLEEAVEKFGNEVVYGRFLASAVIDLQSFIRGKIRATKENEDVDPTSIQESVVEWSPGVRQARGKSSEEKARDAVNKLSPEAREALLAELLAGGDAEEAA